MTAPLGWSTAAVGPDQAFDYWRDLICDAFVQLSARPAPGTGSGGFRGDIEHHTIDDLSLSLVAADGQRVDRTRSLIARSQEEYLLASIQVEGHGTVRQDGRTAELHTGAMAFYDSTRPYTLSFDRAFRQLVIQVPKSSLSGRDVSTATAVPLAPDGSAGLVTGFFLGLARERAAGAAVAGLVPHAVGLLDHALALAVGEPAEPGAVVLRGRIHAAIRRGAGDHDLDAAAVAVACHVSRRTLFRVLGERGETFTELLRAERVRRARSLLCDHPHLPLGAVATRSGFAGAAQLHRAFRRVVGRTPAAWRATSRADGASGHTPGRGPSATDVPHRRQW